MKYYFLFLLSLITATGQAQSVVQSVNSGSLIASSTAVSVGEIVVNPINAQQSNSGMIGILVQLNGTFLEVGHYEVTQNIVAYPNPTNAGISFQGKEALSGESISIYSNSGQLISERKVDASNSLDLSELSSGVYLIRFSNKKINPFKIIKH